MGPGKGVGLMENRCNHCRFYVNVVGQHKTRRLCVAGVKAYHSGSKMLQDNINIYDLILLLGKEKLEAMIGRGGDNLMACGNFVERI